MSVQLPEAQRRLFKKMVRLTVEIHNDRKGCYGAGVVISRSGLILTADHNVVGAKTLTVRRCELAGRGWKITAKGRRIADVIFRDTKADVAVLKLRKPLKTQSVATLGDSDDLKVASPVYRVGRDDIPVAGGHVISFGKCDRIPEFGISIEGDYGGSGGPIFVFDEEIQLVGIMLRVDDDPESPPVAYAVPINTIKSRIFRRKVVREHLDQDD